MIGLAQHEMNCNFCRIHKTLWSTLAMATRVTHHLWLIADVVKVLEDY
jgi:hypothetical protein